RAARRWRLPPSPAGSVIVGPIPLRHAGLDLPPRCTLVPYTTLFRSGSHPGAGRRQAAARAAGGGRAGGRGSLGLGMEAAGREDDRARPRGHPDRARQAVRARPDQLLRDLRQRGGPDRAHLPRRRRRAGLVAGTGRRMSQASRGALAMLALLSVIWSYNWVVMKQVLQWSGPFEFAAWRAGIGTVVLFAILLWRREALRSPPWLPVLLIGAAQTLGFQALVQWALVDGGAGKTAMLAYTMPFWVVRVAWVVLRVRPSRVHSIASGVAFAGLLLMLEPWQGLGSLPSSLLAIGGGLCWAIGTVLSKQLFMRGETGGLSLRDRKSTRLNSSHVEISY